MASYFTVKELAQEIIIIKKSKFIAHVSPAENEAEALNFISNIRQEHHAATHNTYAYRVGLETEYQRYNDDGEPSGTAGRPILEVIRQREIRNLVVVVTRYFGGILLGASGLIQAYTESTVQGLNGAGIIEKVLCKSLKLELAYPWLGKLQSEIGARGYHIFDTQFTERVELDFYLPAEEVQKFTEWVIDATNGQVNCSVGSQIYLNRLSDDKKLML